MMLKTWGRAEQIVEEGLIRLESFSPGQYHFKVKQRDNTETDVYYKFNSKTGIWEYSCCAVNTDKSKKDYGCVMFKGDHTKPQCSHSLACKIWLKKKELI